MVVRQSLLHTAFGYAGGTGKTLPYVNELCNTSVTRIEVGSITWLPIAGNSGRTSGSNEATGEYANSLGLPNVGWQAFKINLPQMVEAAHAADKELWVNVAGFSGQEYAVMAREALELGADGVVLNLSCPNVWGGEGRKAIPSEDPAHVATILRHVRLELEKLPDDMPKKIAGKISPTLVVAHLVALCAVFVESGIVTCVIGSNTVPDRDVLGKDGNHLLAFTAGDDPTIRHRGGASGTPHLDLGVSVVEVLCENLPHHITVIGCLGIATGDDAFRYLTAGAREFQCAAAYMRFGPGVMDDILARLAELLEAE